MKNFVAEVPEKIVFGAGVLRTLGKYAEGLGKRAFIVAGQSVRPEKTALLETVKEQLKEADIQTVIFAEAEQNPTTTTCDRGARLARENGCDLIVGVGGGSPMDAAKFIALLAASGGSAVDYIPGGKFADADDRDLKCLPIIAITTTSGTGSEATPFAVVTNPENGNKPGTGHSFWYPAVSIVDPELTLTLPERVTVNTGLDVFFHAFEAYVSKDENEYADMFAKRAIELVVENLKKCVDNPQDIEARSAMSLANMLAGTAISLSGTFAIHGMGHSISGHFGAAHGETLCALGPALTEYSYRGNIPKFAKVAVLLGADPQQGEEELARSCADRLRQFLAMFGRDITASSLGVTEQSVPALADDALFAMRGAIEATPVAMTRQDIIDVYMKSM